MDPFELTRVIASIGTTIGVAIAAWQFWRNVEQSRTAFEDSLAKEYRELMRCIPYRALIGREISTEQIERSKEAIYNYLDFCNQQIFLRINKRVRKGTWLEWQSGMKINFSLPLFKEVAAEVFVALPTIYEELRHIQVDEFSTDPAGWKK